VVESLGLTYKCHYPHYANKTARGCKLSPLHSRLEAQGAYFRDVSGWEGADWYAGPGKVPSPGPLSWGRHDWFDQWASEHAACRTGTALIDMSFMSKFMVSGADAGRLLDRLSTAKVDGDVGRISYTQWLNRKGTLEADLTVTKLAPEAESN